MSIPIRVCFVCLGNICRSPTAEAIFLDRIQRADLASHFVVDSAGTGAWHAGEQAHRTTRAVAEARGIKVPSISRQFVASDFARFDYVLAMDRSNQKNLHALTNDANALAKIHLFRNFDPESAPESDVPDPYLEGGFEGVFDICERAADGFLAQLRETHSLDS